MSESTFDFARPYTLWAGLLGGGFLSMASHGTDQLIVQRLLTCRDLRASQRALVSSGFAVVFQFALFLVIGLGLWAFYGGRGFERGDEIFALFIVAPAMYALWLGFTDRHLLMPEATSSIGAANYLELVSSELFRTCLRNTALFAIAVVIIQTSVALMLALLIDKKLRLTSFYRSAFFSPTIMSLVVVSVLWTFLLNPSVGMINTLYFVSSPAAICSSETSV